MSRQSRRMAPMSLPVIEVENLSKCYRLGQFDAQTMREEEQFLRPAARQRTRLASRQLLILGAEGRVHRPRGLGQTGLRARLAADELWCSGGLIPFEKVSFFLVFH